MLWLWIGIPSFYFILVPKGYYSWPFCSEYVAGDQTKLKQHILICSSPVKSRLTKPWENLTTLCLKVMSSNSPSKDSACSSDNSDEFNNEYCGYSSNEESELKKCRKNNTVGMGRCSISEAQ